MHFGKLMQIGLPSPNLFSPKLLGQIIGMESDGIRCILDPPDWEAKAICVHNKKKKKCVEPIAYSDHVVRPTMKLCLFTFKL